MGKKIPDKLTEKKQQQAWFGGREIEQKQCLSRSESRPGLYQGIHTTLTARIAVLCRRDLLAAKS
jgi:hypothetical protein